MCTTHEEDKHARSVLWKERKNWKTEKFCKPKVSGSCPEVFCKKGILKNFTKFTGKHLRQSLIFYKVSGLSLQLIKKETLVQVFFCEFCEIFKNTFFIKYLRWLLLKGSGIERYKVKYINHSECKECPWGMVEFPMLFCFLKQQIKF